MPACIWMRKDNPMNFLSSKKLKQRSRGQLLGKYKTTVLSYLFIQSTLFVILQFAATNTANTAAGMILYFAIYFIVTLFSGIFTFGQCHLYLRIAREDTCSLNDTWYGFKNYPDKAIGIQCILCIIGLFSGIPFFVCYNLFLTTKDTLYIIPFILTLILFAILTTFFYLMFSQSFYLLRDHPDWKVGKILKESTRLMKGHKLRLLYLNVSFLGLQFLGILTMGIGLLWVTPYMYMAKTNFYENLTGKLEHESSSVDVIV